MPALGPEAGAAAGAEPATFPGEIMEANFECAAAEEECTVTTTPLLVRAGLPLALLVLAALAGEPAGVRAAISAETAAVGVE